MFKKKTLLLILAILIISFSSANGYTAGDIASKRISNLTHIANKQYQRYSDRSQYDEKLTESWNNVVRELITYLTVYDSGNVDENAVNSLISGINNGRIKIRKVDNKFQAISSVNPKIKLSKYDKILIGRLDKIDKDIDFNTFDSISKSDQDIIKDIAAQYNRVVKKAYVLTGQMTPPFTDSIGNLYMHENDFTLFKKLKILRPILFHEAGHLPDKIANAGISLAKNVSIDRIDGEFESTLDTMDSHISESIQLTLNIVEKMEKMKGAWRTKKDFLELEEAAKRKVEEGLNDIKPRVAESARMSKELSNMFFDDFEEFYIDNLVFQFLTNDEVERFLEYMVSDHTGRNRYKNPNQRLLSIVKDPYGYIKKHYTKDLMLNNKEEVFNYIDSMTLGG